MWLKKLEMYSENYNERRIGIEREREIRKENKKNENTLSLGKKERKYQKY